MITLISADKSETDVHFIQRDMELVVVSNCCGAELFKHGVSGWWSCTVCSGERHEVKSYTDRVDLTHYTGMFSSDDETKSNTWAPFLSEWFGLKEGSLKIQWTELS